MENRRRGNFMIILAVILGLITAFLAFTYFVTLERQIGDRVLVVVATQDISELTLLTDEMLEEREIPRQFVNDAFIYSKADLLAADNITTVDILAGQPIQTNMVDSNAGLDPGYRAVALAVDEIGSVGGNVKIGQIVDIVVSYEDENNEAVTRILLESVKVIAVNSALPDGFQDDFSPIAQSKFLPDGSLIKDGVVTLALRPEDAAEVVFMSNFARDVRLVIRRLDEAETAPVDPIRFDAFSEIETAR